MVRAVYKDGQVKLMEPVPSQWADGQELTIDASEVPPTQAELDAWDDEVGRAARAIPSDEHEQFLRAVDAHRDEAKRSVRREWGFE